MQGPLLLDRYRPMQQAGTGGSGVVDICWDERIQRRVAIKRMPITQQGGAVPGLTEARTGALLKHPSIVSVIDFEARGGEAYLIMEAIDGPSLPHLIEQTEPGTFDLDIIAAVAQATGEALDFAHENQVLHLDIKPENILIESTGRIKVSDFGISELADAQGFGQACGGTIGYMPPEQILGDDLDQRTDEFALACVVYELLCGTCPFDAKNLDGTLNKMDTFDVDPPSMVRTDLDPEVDEILLSAMSPDMDDRFETVLEFIDDLIPLLGNPKAGVKKLKALAESDDEEDEDEDLAEETFWGRFSPRTRNVAGRIGSFVLCWWLAAVSLTGLGLLSAPIALASALVAGVLGAAVPTIGAAAVLLLLAGSAGYSGAIPIPMSLILGVLAIGWLIFEVHGGSAAANSLLITAPLGLAASTPLAPLFAGHSLTLGKAAMTALVQVALAFVLALGTGTHTLLIFHMGLCTGDDILNWADMLTDCSVWIQGTSWVLSAVLMSAFCSRATRVSSIVGAIAASLVQIGAQVLIVWVKTGSVGTPALDWCISIVIALVIMILIGAMGAPYREKEEE